MKLTQKFKMISRTVNIWSKRINLPLFSGLTLYDVTTFFFKGIIEGAVTTRASSIAFSFFLALFPGIIFLFTLIPYIPIDGFQLELFSLLQEIMPPDTYEMAKATIDDVLTHKRGDLLSLTFIIAMVLATNGTLSLLSNFTYSYHNIGYRNFWSQYIVAFLLTIFLAFLLLLGIVMIIMSENFTNWLVEMEYIAQSAAQWFDISRLGILLTIVFLSISVIFYIGPTKKKEWRFISPGSVLATTLVILTSFAFSFYVSNFSQYNTLYGSIGTLMVIMLWIYLNAIGLVIGFELNASVASARKSNQDQLELNIKK